MPLTSHAQVRRQVPAPSQQDNGDFGRQANGDFGRKFFEDLRSLFGRLQRSELDGAFRRAKTIHCSDLAGQMAEWKEVAFLNDDRKLGDWHHENLNDVKSDLVAFVFSGTCRDDQSPLRVATSYPVTESVQQYQQGKIKFSQIVINDNDPVSVSFDSTSGAYTFQLPYVYSERKNGTDIVYTLTPPRTTSTPEAGVAIEFRCKAINDADLTYRFLLCRSRVVNRDGRFREDSPSLGSAAYYILSDGKEASSSVKLDFGREAEPSASTSPEAPPRRTEDRGRFPQPAKSPQIAWQPAAPAARLSLIADDEFKLIFNKQTWMGRIDKPQMIADGNLSAFASTRADARNKQYCTWRPGPPAQVNQLLEPNATDTFGYSLSFRKDTVLSSTFEIQGDNGIAATLQCYFPQSQTPADLTISRWLSIVGKQIELDVRRR
jgi:hypothetical protein